MHRFKAERFKNYQKGKAKVTLQRRLASQQIARAMSNPPEEEM